MSPDPNAPKNPKYKEVCSGVTGHVEVLHIRFNNKVTTYEDLCKFLFTFHDPTTQNKQGNDKGTQYASTIFYHSPEQKKIAQKVIDEVQDLLIDKKIPEAKFKGFKVTTNLSQATIFYPAHKEHQEYLTNNPRGYCNHKVRFNWDNAQDNYVK